jgi:hypothetical protein
LRVEVQIEAAGAVRLVELGGRRRFERARVSRIEVQARREVHRNADHRARVVERLRAGIVEAVGQEPIGDLELDLIEAQPERELHGLAHAELVLHEHSLARDVLVLIE